MTFANGLLVLGHILMAVGYGIHLVYADTALGEASPANPLHDSTRGGGGFCLVTGFGSGKTIKVLPRINPTTFYTPHARHQSRIQGHQ